MEGVLLLVFLAGEQVPEPVAKEFAALRGTWDIVSAEVGGRKVGPGRVFDGTVRSVRFTDERPRRLETRCDVYTVTLDPAASPRRLTGAVAGGEIKGEKVLGIYRRDGDRLTVCWEHGAAEYPAEFKSAGDRIVLHLERAKK